LQRAAALTLLRGACGIGVGAGKHGPSEKSEDQRPKSEERAGAKTGKPEELPMNMRDYSIYRLLINAHDDYLTVFEQNKTFECMGKWFPVRWAAAGARSCFHWILFERVPL
jgi:hypothetical protein